MSSSTLRGRPRPEPGSVLPIDVLYDILMRLPAKPLCRLRAVCRTWRLILSNPQFIAAHAARHPRLLIFAGHDKSHRDEGVLCDIMDLSGRVVKRIRSAENEWVISTQLNLACVAKSKSCKVLNLATGEALSLPDGLSEEHTPRMMYFLNYRAVVAFGQTASTREYKVLRVIDNGFFSNPYEQLCEVFTLGDSGDARWRGKRASPRPVDMSPLSRVAIDGIVYFLLDENVVDLAVQPKGIASFDLSTEDWRPILRLPLPIMVVEEDLAHNVNLSLAALNGSLVLVDQILNFPMDLWFLMDFEKGLWVKQYTVQVNLNVPCDEFFAHPLVILNDGRIVTYIGSRGLLRIYNPRRRTYTNIAEMGTRIGIGLYTGNLLSLANGAIY